MPVARGLLRVTSLPWAASRAWQIRAGQCLGAAKRPRVSSSCTNAGSNAGYCSSSQSNPQSRNASSQNSKGHAGIALALGAGSGALGACAGVGGAVFLVPGLVRYCGLPQPVAAGTAMALVVTVSTTSAAIYASDASISWETGALLALPAAVATPFGASLASRVNPKFLRRALGSFLLALAPIMPLRSHLLQRKEDFVTLPDAENSNAPSPSKAFASAAPELACADESMEASSTAAQKNFSLGTFFSRAGTVLVGAGIGFGAGMLGIGGGSLMTPFIAFLHPDMPMTSILGTSFAAMLPPSLVAAAVYYRLGIMRVRLVVPIVIGAAIGAAAGTEVVCAAPDNLLRWFFATIFFSLGVRVLQAPLRHKIKTKPISKSP